MTPKQSAHLSEEAVNDVLIGLGSLESKAHLGVCSICSSRVKEFRSEVNAFNRATLAWSEARPRATLDEDERRRVRWIAASPLSWALAAALLLAVGFPVWNHLKPAADNASVPSPLHEDSQTQIAQDNDLLNSVNVALNEGEESPVAVYQLSEAPHPRLKARPELRKQ
jgi:anti-sigma factor RsiW